jgi:hypothetical protein
MGVKVLRMGMVVFSVLTDKVLYIVTVGLDRSIAKTQI